MKIIRDLRLMRNQRRPVILVAGFFDGVHRGHQRLLKLAEAEANRRAGSAWVMTFDTHPMKVLDPARAPMLLTSSSHKLGLLRSLGAQGCILVPFTRALAGLEPEPFIDMLKRLVPSLCLLLVGRNWTFGRGGRGTVNILKPLARSHGFGVRAIPPVCWKGRPVSSTRIRRDVTAGRLEDASRMLGRPVSVLGDVVPGTGLGTELGIPTANLDPHNEVHPPDGVYAAQAVIDGRIYPGILNLGTRPTLKNYSRGKGACSRPDKGCARRLLELHVFDMRRDLYRKQVEVFFLKKLRNEREFSSTAALKSRIEQDIEQARKYLARSPRIPLLKKNIKL